MQIIGHLIGSALGTLFRAIFFGLVGGAVTAGAALLITAQGMHQWPPSIPEYIIGGIVALLAAYATGTTVILRSLVRDALTAVKDVEKAI